MVITQAFELQVFEKLQLVYAFKDTSQQSPEASLKIITLAEEFANEIQVIIMPKSIQLHLHNF
jgi:hypothetical protein